MSWDPLSAWPDERRWIWLTIAGWLLLLRGSIFVENFQAKPPRELVPDFFQEYASARGWHEGLPVYADHHESARRYLGVPLNDRRSHVVVNAHPPTSVLLALPFARLGFDRAFLIWNLASLAALAVSLAIVWRALSIPFSAWSIAPLVSLLLLCFPFWEQCRLGQLTLILLLLVTAAWAAERSGWPRLAGVLLGAAACVKLFPGFLFIYYALRGRWRVVIAGLIAVVGLSALTAAVLGVEAYRTYFVTVLPEVQWFRVGWNNDSFWGFWSRLFDPAPEHERDRSLTEPLYYSPMLATGLSLISAAMITGILARDVRRWAKGSPSKLSAVPYAEPTAAPSSKGSGIETASIERTSDIPPKTRQDDLTFAMAVGAMLLISPICWEHYLLLLLAPLAIVWMELPASRSARAAFVTIVAAFWLGYPVTWTAFGLNGRTATPIDSVGILSYQFYALLGFFALARMELMRLRGREISPEVATRRTFTVCAAVMVALWVPVLHGIWRDYGLFYFMGLDFGIYRSAAAAAIAEGPTAMYDMDAVASHARELMTYYGPAARGLNVGPMAYPAIFLLPVLPLDALAPPLGYVIWTGLGLALSYAAVAGMAARWPGAGRGLVVAGVLSFPVATALFLGQVTPLFLYGFSRAYRSLEREHDFRAGLWCGALYVKPQYAAFLFLVFLLKRRWRALGGLALAGAIVLLGSMAIVGPDGMRAWYETLRGMSGFRDVPPMIGPQWMINWRGVLAVVLPEGVSDRTGQVLTSILSILTVGLLLLIWRGRWDPRGDRFGVQMLATIIVMMMASYHNHAHSAALLLVPGIAVAAQGSGPRSLRTILAAGLLAPVLLYFFTASMMYVSWLLIVLMLAALGIIVHDELGLSTVCSEARRIDSHGMSREN